MTTEKRRQENQNTTEQRLEKRRATKPRHPGDLQDRKGEGM